MSPSPTRSAYSPRRSSSGNKITPAELHARTTKGDYAQAYYFYGPEDYRVVEAEKFLSRQFVGNDANSDLAIRRLSFRQHSLTSVLDELQALSLLGGKRVIAVAEAQSLRPDQFERLATVLKQTDPTRLVILSSPSARLPKWDSAFIKNIGTVATVVEFEAFRTDDIVSMIDRKAVQLKIQFGPGAKEQLLTLVGVRKSAVDREMEKLALYSDGSPITKSEIDRLTSDWTETGASLLAQAILQKDRAKSLAFLQQCLNEGVSTTTLIWQLGGYLTDMLLIRLGEQPSAKWGGVANARKQDAGRFSVQALETAISGVANAEHLLRHSPISDDFVMESLVATLIPSVKNTQSGGKFSARQV